MEEVGLGLEEWELRHSNVEKAFKICHSRCKKIENHFNSTRNSFKAREEEIGLREKQLEEKESYFESLREFKEEKLNAIEEVIPEKLIQVEQFKTELECVSLLVEEKRQKLDSTEKRFLKVEELVREKERECDLIQNRIEEGTSNLRRIEKFIGDNLRGDGELKRKMRKRYQQAKDLELNQAQFDFQSNTEQSEHAPGANNKAIPLCGNNVTNIISSLAKTEKLESSLATNSTTFLSSNVQPYATSYQRNVPGFLEDNMGENDSTDNELAASLRLVPDPAKLVLNYMQKFFARSLRNGRFEERIMLPSNISVLKELLIVSPHVGLHLKEDSTTLVAQWKEKMRGNTVKTEESLVFLMFIAMYGLVSMLNVDEIVTLLGLISQNKRVLELCHAYGFAVKIADFILILIQKKHIMEAVRFICIFKLIDKLPPIPLLKEYVEDEKKCFQVLCRIRIALDEKVKAVDNLIGCLRAVRQCIKDYNLKSELSAHIEKQVVQLEKLKKTWRLLAPLVGSNDEQKEQRKKKESDNKTCSPEFQPGQHSKLQKLISSGF